MALETDGLSLEADYRLMYSAVREAGELAMRYYGQDMAVWRKSNDTLVSSADIAVDDFLKARLKGARPGYGWLSEETEDSADRLGRMRVWVVDPIDGTRAFLKHEPHFTISVALLHRELPLHAAVLNPATGEFFTASAGRGARLNGAAISTSSRRTLEGCRMLGDAGMFAHPAWPEPWPPMRIETRNSIAYRLAMVAAGRFDAAVALNRKQDWDIAAADLVLRESGACFSLHSGGPLVFNRPQPIHRSVMASGPALYPELIRRIGHLDLP